MDALTHTSYESRPTQHDAQVLQWRYVVFLTCTSTIRVGGWCSCSQSNGLFRARLRTGARARVSEGKIRLKLRNTRITQFQNAQAGSSPVVPPWQARFSNQRSDGFEEWIDANPSRMPLRFFCGFLAWFAFFSISKERPIAANPHKDLFPATYGNAAGS
jgi:hypothetical protein